jgi:alanyl-tRNA synthetase
MTERLYYTDSYCRGFDACVVRATEHDGLPAAVLDRTAFYPTSGGQPFDRGHVGGVAVRDVVDDGSEVVHVLERPLAPGARVYGAIEWPRRFDHMQQHTGQHVLSAACDRLLANGTVGFHMGADTSTIDLGDEVGRADLERAVDEANQVIWEDRPVTVRFATAEEAAALPLRKEPARDGRLRLVEIEGFDLSACGGTHVARTGAVGLIAVLGLERLRRGTRVTFVCGGRALGAWRQYRDAVQGATRVLSVLPAELPAALERVQAESRALHRAWRSAQASLATHEAARLVDASAEIRGRRVVVHVLDGWDAAGLKAIATALAGTANAAVALVSASSPALIVVARAPDVNVDAAVVLRALIEQYGGRGGGKPDLAQGGGLIGDPLAIADAARRLLGPADARDPG